MGMRRTDQDDMDLAGPRQVVGKAAGAGQKPIVLDTLDVLGLAERRHTLLLENRPRRVGPDYSGGPMCDKAASFRASQAAVTVR
jgi:hypothetical protein